MNWKFFLQNLNNKQQFIKMSDYLKIISYQICQTISNVNTAVSRRALEQSSNNKKVAAAEDTHILILLSYHWNANKNLIPFSTEQCKGQGQRKLKYLLFAHALSWYGRLQHLQCISKIRILLAMYAYIKVIYKTIE